MAVAQYIAGKKERGEPAANAAAPAPPSQGPDAAAIDLSGTAAPLVEGGRLVIAEEVW